MVRGGLADKFGNRYEAKWVVRSLMDVIYSKAEWLNFESVNTEYQGFEFALARKNITEWYQTKINAPHGNWTIRELEKSGILRAFKKRLLADNHSHCYLISQDPAIAFRRIIGKAKISNDSKQFLNVLSQKQLSQYNEIRKIWGLSDDLVFEMLKRAHALTLPEEELDSIINTIGDIIFHNGGNLAFPVLRKILEDNFNTKLTTEKIRDLVRSAGSLEIKDWSLSPTIKSCLKDETEAYLETYAPFGSGGKTISRSQTDILCDELLRSNGHDLILLTGVAGSGKSGVVRSAIQKLKSENIPYLGFRIDHHLGCTTREELGKQLTGREESPVNTLKGTYSDRNSVLFIDQVDAISDVAGRDGRVKEVVLRLIKDAVNLQGIKVVAVCRTFDLDSDSRLKRLEKNDRTIQIEVPLLNWEEEVSPLLKNKGFKVSNFNQPQREILKVPKNLAVFFEIDEPEISFRSPFNLYEQLLEKKQTKIFKNWNVSWPLIKPLKVMGVWMSNRQKLSAPDAILDNYSNALKILTSEGLVVSSRGQINFFHESFFDYIYARIFISNEKSLLELLLSAEQNLFRRTQVRQILETLRQADSGRYLNELSSVLFSNEIRFHIKTAICQWLNTVDEPTKEEFKIISDLDDGIGNYNQLFRRAIFSHSNWFTLLNKIGWIQKQLRKENIDNINTILRWLNATANEHSSETAHLLRDWWEGREKNGSQILNWFGYVDNPKSPEKLIQLFEDIINTHPEIIFKGSYNHNIDLILHSWTNASPEYSALILRKIIESWFAANSEGIPFSREKDFIIRHHSLNTLFKKSPEAFLIGTTDGLIKSVDRIVDGNVDDLSMFEFNHRTYSGGTHGFDQFLGLYRSALKQVSNESPNIAASYLDQFDAGKHECLMNLHLEVIQENPQEFGYRLSKLIKFESVFDAGWNGAKWHSFAHAVRKAIPYLKTHEKKLLDECILEYNAEIKLAYSSLKTISELGEDESYVKKKDIVSRYLNRSGHKQWCIIETIGEELLSEKAKYQLQLLRRKFPNEKLPKPSHNVASLVPSPIDRKKCEKMDDQQWLSAINHYDGKKSGNLAKDFLKGGARQLAGELKEATKKNPTRFSDLCLQIPYTAHHSYFEHILWGLGESETLELNSLIQVIKYTDQHPKKRFGREIIWVVEKHPNAAENPKILDIILWYATNGDAEEDSNIKHENKQNSTTIDSLIKETGSFYFRGINTVRGSAWEALAAVLWKVEETTEKIWGQLESAIQKEPKISVRCCMTTTLVPLFNADKDRFAKSIQGLVTLPNNEVDKGHELQLYPLITRRGIYLFDFIFRQRSELARDLSNKLLSCKVKNVALLGAYLIYRESFRAESYIKEADQLASLDNNHRRLLAEVTTQVSKWDVNLDRVMRLLKQFFYDEHSHIREQVSKVFHDVSDAKEELIEEIAPVFLNSPSFVENPEPFIYCLEKVTFDVQNLVIEASQKIINKINQEKELNVYKGDRDMYKLQDLLRREYSSSASNPTARKQILDLIDQMLMNDIYGVEKIVAAHDRW